MKNLTKKLKLSLQSDESDSLLVLYDLKGTQT